MRKLQLLILLGLFICSYQLTRAQVFAYPGARWVFYSPLGMGFCSKVYQVWEYSGDTVINGENAKIISANYKNSAAWDSTSFLTYNIQHYFKVEADTVSILNPADTSWVELYNFSVSIGDSVTSPMDNFMNGLADMCPDSLPYNNKGVVTNTGTSLLYGQNLRYYTVQYYVSHDSTTASVTYYERMITYGYWYPNPYVCNVTDWCDPPHLLCYKDDGMITDSLCSDISWIETLSIPEPPQGSSTIKIYPNPTTEVLVVNNPSNQSEKYSVLAADGKLILTNIQSPINTFNLSAGVYFITNEERSWYRKFIKN